MKETLTREQFDILEQYATSKQNRRMEDLTSNTQYDADTINKIKSELVSLGYLNSEKITKAGLDVMENYRVKRAVFFAAGFGSRLKPITLNTPKPLVRVNGKRIIEGLLDAVVAAGIEEIIIVRGYLAEEFDILLKKYPNIKFIDNTAYDQANNIGSALLAKDLLSNAYVFEADLLIYNPSIVKKYHYKSNFLGIKKEKSDDWCLVTDNGIIIEDKLGGTNCYQMVGISYWDEKDGKKLSKHIEEAFNKLPGGKQLYWEQVPLDRFKDEYKVEIRECLQEDIIEIDTFKELQQIDDKYIV